LVERVDLVPHVTPHPDQSTSLSPVEVPKRQLREVPQTRRALVGGEVGRALHQAVHRRQGADVQARCREPPRPAGRVLGRGVQQREQHEPHGVGALREVLGVHEDQQNIVVRGRREEVCVGEAEEAGIVVHGGVLIERAKLLRVLEACGDAAVAGGGVDVPAAEREGVDHVRDRAGSARGEEGRVGRGFPGEGCEQLI